MLQLTQLVLIAWARAAAVAAFDVAAEVGRGIRCSSLMAIKWLDGKRKLLRGNQ